MGITGVRMFVRDEEPTTIEHFLNHFDHVGRLTSVQHLGVGSDIDLYGYDAMPPERTSGCARATRAAMAFATRSTSRVSITRGGCSISPRV